MANQWSRKIRVLHIINCLDPGGAEHMLANLLSHMNADRFDSGVISLLDEGIVGKEIKLNGFPVHAINMTYLTAPFAAVDLALKIRQFKPDIVQTWMYHSNFLGGLAARLVTSAPVVWGIHATQLDPDFVKISASLAIWGSKFVASWLPERIVFCSRESAEFHLAQGYPDSRATLIPNGFDLARFSPDGNAYLSVRQELGFDGNSTLIGLVSRYHPNKDHSTFLDAAAILLQRRPSVRFMACGRGVTEDNSVLMAKIRQHQLEDRVRLLGERRDVPRLTAALDIACSTSHIGEAFPLALGEAMACSVPCVTTDVGDAAYLVGDTGRVVPTRDPDALARAWDQVLQLSSIERQNLGYAARQRVETFFSIQRISAKYEDVYVKISKKGR